MERKRRFGNLVVEKGFCEEFDVMTGMQKQRLLEQELGLRLPIGQILLARGSLDEQQYRLALRDSNSHIPLPRGEAPRICQLVDLAVEQGYCTRDQLDEVIDAREREGTARFPCNDLCNLLIERGYLGRSEWRATEEQLLKRSRQWQCQARVSLSSLELRAWEMATNLNGEGFEDLLDYHALKKQAFRLFDRCLSVGELLVIRDRLPIAQYKWAISQGRTLPRDVQDAAQRKLVTFEQGFEAFAAAAGRRGVAEELVARGYLSEVRLQEIRSARGLGRIKALAVRGALVASAGAALGAAALFLL